MNVGTIIKDRRIEWAIVKKIDETADKLEGADRSDKPEQENTGNIAEIRVRT
jgi:hypothetical protein